VLGSEPEILFYARRRSATGFLYMYPLMEPHRYAVAMHQRMIAELEAVRPEYVVFVAHSFSWLRRPTSRTELLDWWTGRGQSQYDLEQIVPLAGERAAASTAPGETAPLADVGDCLMVWRRKDTGA